MEEPKRGPGRPPVPPEDKLVHITIRGPRALKQKVKEGGNSWARAVLTKAKLPPKPPPTDS